MIPIRMNDFRKFRNKFSFKNKSQMLFIEYINTTLGQGITFKFILKITKKFVKFSTKS